MWGCEMPTDVRGPTKQSLLAEERKRRMSSGALAQKKLRGNDRNPNGPRPAQRGSVARRFRSAIERGSPPDYAPGERAAQIDSKNDCEQRIMDAVGSCGVNETIATSAASWNRGASKTTLSYL
jgi:hypothetical protein